jgi:hypothetical protein
LLAKLFVEDVRLGVKSISGPADSSELEESSEDEEELSSSSSPEEDQSCNTHQLFRRSFNFSLTILVSFPIPDFPLHCSFDFSLAISMKVIRRFLVEPWFV